MGLPQIEFSLKVAAKTVAARISQGVVALILEDAKALGTYTIYQEADIPTELGEDNIAYVKRALTGYINRPAYIYLTVVSAESGIAAGFANLGAYSYDYIAGPPDIDPTDAETLSGLVIAQRTKRYIGKAVLPNVDADDEGVINFTATGIKVGSDEYETGEYCSRIAGVLAGTPSDCSATNAPLPEVTAVDAVSNPDSAIDGGELILVG